MRGRYVRCVDVEESGRENPTLRYACVKDFLTAGCVVVRGVSFAAFDVVADIFDDGGWCISVLEFGSECVYVDCIECFAHV